MQPGNEYKATDIAVLLQLKDSQTKKLLRDLAGMGKSLQKATTETTDPDCALQMRKNAGKDNYSTENIYNFSSNSSNFDGKSHLSAVDHGAERSRASDVSSIIQGTIFQKKRKGTTS